MKKVVKFGGSSLASAEQFKKVRDVIDSDPDRRYVVVSAPGKRTPKDKKVTDMLYECYDLAESGKARFGWTTISENRSISISTTTAWTLPFPSFKDSMTTCA